MTADCSRLLVRHRKMNVFQTSDACAAVRIVNCWWSADEDVKVMSADTVTQLRVRVLQLYVYGRTTMWTTMYDNMHCSAEYIEKFLTYAEVILTSKCDDASKVLSTTSVIMCRAGLEVRRYGPCLLYTSPSPRD